jgi:hypothetical protein
MQALGAVLPAGTLSGAPKVRAMEIIDELESVKRGAYGGAVGWLSYAGDLDTCICIRTVVVKDGVAHVQAGGGTVADARPDYEYEESRAKARGVVGAIETACRQDGADHARAGDRQLRLLHLQPRPVPRRAGRRRGGGPQRPRHRRRPAGTPIPPRPWDRAVVSPGPCTPAEAGISVEAMRRLPEAGIPTLGVCLGHQSLAQAFGGTVIRHVPVHGKDDRDRARRHGASSPGCPSGCGRPLPLARGRRGAARRLVETARGGGVLMAMRHRELPVAACSSTRVRAHAEGKRCWRLPVPTPS